MENDLESDPQNTLHEDLKEILSEEKIKEGHTDPRKTSAGRRMIAIVDDEEEGISNTWTNTSWAERVCFEWAHLIFLFPADN